MGTTTASKHGLRAAATERRNKHAQNTPLPPKGGVVPVETPANAARYGAMTQPQLYRLSASLGINASADAPKGTLLTAILAKERQNRAASVCPNPWHQSSPARAKQLCPECPAETHEDRIRAGQERKRQKRADEDAPKQWASISDDTLDQSRSWAKASALMAEAIANGWDCNPVRYEDDLVELLMKRGNEALWISWTGGVLTTNPMPTYTVSDRTIKLRNASAVKQHLVRSPEAGQADLERVSKNQFFRRKPTEPKRQALPFDVKLATDEEVLAALTGKAVSWHNQYREFEEAAVVGVRGGKQPVELRPREDGERVLWFCCPATGFRAFALSQLTRVGSRKLRTRGERNSGEHEPVEVEA